MIDLSGEWMPALHTWFSSVATTSNYFATFQRYGIDFDRLKRRATVSIQTNTNASEEGTGEALI